MSEAAPRRNPGEGESRSGGIPSAALLLLATIVGVVLPRIPLLLLPSFTGDEWYYILVGTRFPQSEFWWYHGTDRPVAFFSLMVAIKALGTSPLAWQLFGIAAWTLIVLLALGILRIVWPACGGHLPLIGVVLASFPGFNQHGSAMGYFGQYLTLVAGFLSILLSLRAGTPGNRRPAILTGLAVALQLTYLSLIEHYISLEVLRLLLLLVVASGDDLASRLKAWGRRCLPYLAASLCFLAWRLFFFETAREATSVSHLASRYVEAGPFTMAVRIGINWLRDILNAGLFVWFVPTWRHITDAYSIDVAAAVGLALLVGGLAWRASIATRGAEPDHRDGVSMTLVGFAALGIGLLPSGLAMRWIALDTTYNRYTLPVMLASVILLTGTLFVSCRTRRVVSSALVLLAVLASTSQGLANAGRARYWERQRQFWWQLSWRVPGLPPDATLAVVPTRDFWDLDDVIWAPLNLMAPGDPVRHPRPGLFLRGASLEKIESAARFEEPLWTAKLKVDPSRLVAVVPPTGCACLRIGGEGLEPAAVDTSAAVARVLASAKPGLILLEGEGFEPPAGMLGRSKRGWCFFFQRADLARQRGRWEEVGRIENEARAAKERPGCASEWSPFLEARVVTGELSTSVSLDGGGDSAPAPECQPFDWRRWSEAMMRRHPEIPDIEERTRTARLLVEAGADRRNPGAGKGPSRPQPEVNGKPGTGEAK